MDRIIGEIQGQPGGPLVIFVGGLHGNEHQGVIALENVLNEYKDRNIKGKVIAIRGNLKALSQNKRYLTHDLNRIWNETLSADEQGEEFDEKEQIKELINNELNRGEYSSSYLIDLHTTSAPTVPFIVTTQQKHILEFVNKLDVPFVTGLSGFLDGTMLHWMSNKGHCGLAFEAGQHHSKKSMIKHEAFSKLCFHHTGALEDMAYWELEDLKDLLSDELGPKHNHFKLVERYEIDDTEDFTMEPGFTNFQKIYKSEVLATNQYGDILSATNGNIFMPLYQKQGNDGFFIIEPQKSN
ncbi:MAG: succinylglutamate desuccinylase/aspartoacylase family protein [Bacteroidia bacterium]